MSRKWSGYIRAFSPIIILEAAKNFSGQIVGRTNDVIKNPSIIVNLITSACLS